MTSAGPGRSIVPSRADAGWAVADRDGLVVTADERLARLLDAPSADALRGRSWASLVSPRAGVAGGDVDRAIAAGAAWSGRLELLFAEAPLDAAVRVIPAAGDLVLLSVSPYTESPQAQPAGDGDGSRIAALEASRSGDVAAAARAVLQAVHGAVAFDWAVVLRLPSAAAEVLAVYPSAMAGVAPGGGWSPLDDAEQTLLATGEPSLAADLVAAPGDRSPLARMSAFGMRSVVRIPLFRGPAPAGAVALYAARRRAFAVEQGVLAEQLVRPLADRLDAVTPPGPRLGATPEPPQPPPRPQANAAPDAEPPASEEPLSGEEVALPQALGDFVSGVADELNNPLAVVLGYAQVLPRLGEDERGAALAAIERGAERASRVVRDLLAFARQRPQDTTAVDVAALLRRVVEARWYGLSSDGVAIEMNLAPLPPVEASEEQLQEVFEQLVDNAHEVLRAAGGTVAISAEPADGGVRVAVTDSGPGVPEDVVQRIFEPFVAAREIGHGSGLGLAVVHALVTAHGGRVWVERAPTRGSRFVVELPLRREPPTVPPPPPPRPPREPAVQRLLIVDDQVPIRALIAEICGAAGYRAVAVGSAQEALDRMAEERFDLILADVRMPGMDGIELYERIVAHHPHLGRRVLFVTADPGNERLAELVENGQARVLGKPFSIDQLLAAVREALAAP